MPSPGPKLEKLVASDPCCWCYQHLLAQGYLGFTPAFSIDKSVSCPICKPSILEGQWNASRVSGMLSSPIREGKSSKLCSSRELSVESPAMAGLGYHHQEGCCPHEAGHICIFSLNWIKQILTCLLSKLVGIGALPSVAWALPLASELTVFLNCSLSPGALLS